MTTPTRVKPTPRPAPSASPRCEAVITSAATYVPDNVLTNRDVAEAADPARLARFVAEGPWFANGRAEALGLSSTLDATTRNRRLFEAFIGERVGIWERRVIDREAILEGRPSRSGRHASDLGAEAARRALASSELEPSDLDVVVCCTASPDRLMPSTASKIQEKIGANGAGGFDLMAACAGFAYGLQVASAMVASGQAAAVLVVAAEYFTSGVDYADPGCSYFWGDGAAAAIVQGDRGDKGLSGWKVCATASRSHPSENARTGTGGTVPKTAAALQARADVEPGDPAYPYVYQDGRRVYRDVVPMVAKTIRETLAEQGLEVADLDELILHQANGVMVGAVARRLGIDGIDDAPRVLRNYERYGNTSSCGAGIALAEDSNAQPGDLALLCAFGAGYTLGVLLLERV